jgi:hypothetical protein
MASEKQPRKRPHLLLAQHVMTEVLEGMKDVVSSEGLDPTVLKELEKVVRVCTRARRSLTPAASPGSAGSATSRNWAAWRATQVPPRPRWQLASAAASSWCRRSTWRMQCPWPASS